MRLTHLPTLAPAETSESAQPAWRRRKDSRGPEILGAARQVFEATGYERASVAEIAALAGVSEATVYKYFDSKRELVNRVIEAWMAPLMEVLERDVWERSGTAERLRLLAIRHLTEMDRAPGLHRLVYRELRWEGYAGSPFHRLNQHYAHLVEQVVAQGVTAGEIRAEVDPRMVRDLFFGGLEHAGWRMVATGSKLDLVSLAESLTSHLFLGVAPKTADGAMDRLASLVERLERKV
jgi:TetR/AcrR family fatty acid metabolism transcriptional regulator